MGRETKGGDTAPGFLKRAAQWGGSLLLRCWWRTLRLRFDDSMCGLKDEPEPVLILLWHNQLFAAPELYRRFFTERRLAAMISASRDGTWLASFLERLGIRPVRGSSHSQGVSAFRNCLKALRSGCDVVITPDGSRGPVYEMKPGAAVLAVKTGAPVYLWSFDYRAAVRLGSWDRFFVPLPFSEVCVAVARVELTTNSGESGVDEALLQLQRRMEASTRDSLLCRAEQ